MNPIKQKALKGIMDAMDMQDGERLKMHPKLIAAKVTIEKPVDEKKMDDLEDPEMEAMDDEDSSGELDGIEDLTELDSLSPELKAKVIKLLSKG
jgi:hypothetical protein